jgi:uncharacterized protein YjbJ (UPF0337 family)
MSILSAIVGVIATLAALESQVSGLAVRSANVVSFAIVTISRSQGDGIMKDRVEGKAHEVKGRVTGDTGEELKGKAQQKAGEAKQEVESATRKGHDSDEADR